MSLIGQFRINSLCKRVVFWSILLTVKWNFLHGEFFSIKHVVKYLCSYMLCKIASTFSWYNQIRNAFTRYYLRLISHSLIANIFNLQKTLPVIHHLNLIVGFHQLDSAACHLLIDTSVTVQGLNGSTWSCLPWRRWLSGRWCGMRERAHCSACTKLVNCFT